LRRRGDGEIQGVRSQPDEDDPAVACGSGGGGPFEHALGEIVEEHLDLSAFDARYGNDETGRLAYDPKILLKVI
jgi:hypothetical protein